MNLDQFLVVSTLSKLLFYLFSEHFVVQLYFRINSNSFLLGLVFHKGIVIPIETIQKVHLFDQLFKVFA